jgi:hypothetical protein
MLTKTSLFATMALLAATSTAAAQSVCGAREALLKQLASEYQEAPAGIGLASNGSVVELLTSKGGTWTLMVTRPNGMTCLIGTGEAWQPIIRKASAEFDS